ncbi:MAG: hypothetical protein LC113_04025 [Acidobacteria bacterium]|nr:hypothetical protein [Acidobacteriota bacterium]
MRFLSENQAFERLERLRGDFAGRIRRDYEQAAKDCGTCETKGACCLDAHFVNVRVSRLEAAAIRHAIGELTPELQRRVSERSAAAIEWYGLRNEADPEKATYACPLFEPAVGCLVHTTAKPLPCIHHACYERNEDRPPDAILEDAEAAVDSLNIRVYGKANVPLPIPLAIV